jgi:hypothetical protein
MKGGIGSETIVDSLHKFQFSVPAGCSRGYLPCCGGRPLRPLGSIRPAKCGMGQLCTIRCVHGAAQLVLAPNLDPGRSRLVYMRGICIRGPPRCGWHTRLTAFLSGILLMMFAVAMALALGVKAPLNASVFSAAGGALLLATCTKFPFSLDDLLHR